MSCGLRCGTGPGLNSRATSKGIRLKVQPVGARNARTPHSPQQALNRACPSVAAQVETLNRGSRVSCRAQATVLNEVATPLPAVEDRAATLSAEEASLTGSFPSPLSGGSPLRACELDDLPWDFEKGYLNFRAVALPDLEIHGLDGEDSAARAGRTCRLPVWPTAELEGIPVLEHKVVDDSTSSPLQAVMQSKPPSTSNENGLGDDYHVNVGYAIRTLREELPTLFYKEMSYGIYRDDITFKDPLNSITGISNYRTIFWALRFHGRIFFKALWVEVKRVWQPNDRTIIIRWSVRGIPRVPWEARGQFDGTSEYKLDKDGKIYVHKVDNIALSDPPKYRALTVVEMMQMAGVRPTPGITCFSRCHQMTESLLPGSAPSGPAEATATYQHVMTGVQYALWLLGLGPIETELSSFTWFRFYLALTGTLAVSSRFQLCM